MFSTTFMTMCILFLVMAFSFAHATSIPISSSIGSCHDDSSPVIKAKKWHPLTLTFNGPFSCETDANNPFLNYRLTVTFTHVDSNKTLKVPGYFAADGNAANTGAEKGNKWRAHFTPSLAGKWRSSASFRTGTNIALSIEPFAGKATSFDESCVILIVDDQTGSLKGKRDNRGRGILRYNGGRYLRFDNGEYFLKGGADSPETFLAYKDFDGTFSQTGANLKSYASHLKDWKPGNPTWKRGKGKEIIGALNYLASTGANAFSFLTFNVNGDGKNVWPFITPFDFHRFDVSKLDQWNIVFTHADTLGMFMHFKTQEIENDVILDKGRLGISRKLYYREIIARFAHHHALNWNLGEENDIWKEIDDPTQSNVKQYIKYFHDLDPYRHPVVIHSYPGQHENVYKPLLGKTANLDGMSLQTHWWNVHNMTLEWLNRAKCAGKQWVVSNDEQNDPQHGVIPDGPKSNRDRIRSNVLWGNLMAGGAGVEYYFGYSHAHNDLNAEDWRTRASKWEDIKHALKFFHTFTPFHEMHAAQHLTESKNVYVLAKYGDTIVFYFHRGESSVIKVPKGRYRTYWYNPRTGTLFKRARNIISGPAIIRQGHPDNEDWAMLFKSF